MSATIQPPDAAVNRRRRTEAARWPQLLEGSELIGPMVGSGLREPPYLLRRGDGQVVQLSKLLYVIASRMDGRDLAAIAEDAGQQLNVRIAPEQVAYVAQHKLFPLGLVASRDGTVPKLERRNALLALKFRAGILPERTVNRLAGPLTPLFMPPVVIAALAAIIACDVWLALTPSLGAGLGTVIQTPTLALGLFAVTTLSLFFHECGHAAACRYGGARPGRIGIGIYLVWPVFYTDVTDSYRLAKAGRLRTDLGGVYFNLLLALTAAAAYLATTFKPLALVIVSQQLLILDQFIPWVRLDGYHIVSDLIGVSDLFARIKPVIGSLLPGQTPGPRVTEIKPWARAAVTTWVLSTVTALTAVALIIIINTPNYLHHAWQSLLLQLASTAHNAQSENTIALLSSAIGVIMLLLPAVAMTLTYLLLCRGIGTSLAIRRARTEPTTPAGYGEKPTSQSRPTPHPPPHARGTLDLTPTTTQTHQEPNTSLTARGIQPNSLRHQQPRSHDQPGHIAVAPPGGQEGAIKQREVANERTGHLPQIQPRPSPTSPPNHTSRHTASPRR